MPSSRRAAVAARLRAYVLVPDAVSQMRVTDQPHRLTCPLPCLPGDRVHERPRVARPRRHAFLRRRVVGEVLDQIACVASCGVPRAGPRSVRARRRPACRRRQASRWREAPRRDGLSVVAGHQRPRRMVSPAHDGQARLERPRRSRAALPVRCSRGPAGVGLLRTRRHNRTLPGTAVRRRDSPRKLALAARLRSAPHRHKDVRPPTSVVQRGAERSTAVDRVLGRSQQPARQGPSVSHHRERRPARGTADSPDDRDRIVLTRKSPTRD